MNENLRESPTPFGTVTFLFTDLEGSSHLWHKYPETMQADLVRHDELLRQAIESHQGVVVKTTGDGYHAAFAYPLDALRAAVDSQRELLAQTWQSGDPLAVRMGLHTGQATRRDGDYYGPAVNRAARVMAIASGGQILLSSVTAELVRDELLGQITFKDLGNHRLRSLDRSERLYQLEHPDLPADFPPIEASRETPNNLPTQLTSFIGRDREITLVKDKFDHYEDTALFEKTGLHKRLVTLTGPGGTGKTRLSLEVANDLLPEYRDGVWLVEFAPLTDPEQVGPAVAQTLGLRELPGQPVFELVSNYLRRKQALLILDNCEHLIEACASLAEGLLQNCPVLHIMASSREVLGVAGEQVVRVGAMSLPKNGVAKNAEELADFDAIHLFVSRAQAVKNSFRLNDTNAQAVLDICRRLDGIPLAIELAAARAGVLSPGQILERLDDRFRLLTGGRRTALPRQRTLQALIDWSYDLLTEEEATLLRRVSVFAGGWTLEAAEYVAGVPPLEKYDVLDLLEHLRNKSLIYTEEGELGMRYQVLETIRQYAQEKLATHEEAETMRDRQMEYYLEQVETGGQAIENLQGGGWMEKLLAETDNIRGARERALDRDLKAALTFLANIPHYFYIILPKSESVPYITKTLSLAEADQHYSGEDAAAQDRILFARALTKTALVFFNIGLDEAIDYAERAIAIARQYEENQILVEGLRIHTAFMGARKSDYEKAKASNDEMHSLLPAVGMKYVKALALISIGHYFMTPRDQLAPAGVWEDWQEGMSMLRQGGDLWGMAFGHSMAATATYNHGEFQRAQHHADRALSLYEEIGERQMVNISLGILANLAREEGDLDRAESYYHRSLAIWQEAGHHGGIARCIEVLAYISRVRAQNIEGDRAKELLPRAATLLGAAAVLRQRYNAVIPVVEAEELEKELAQLKELAGEPLFSTAWQLGERMDLDQLVAFAKGG